MFAARGLRRQPLPSVHCVVQTQVTTRAGHPTPRKSRRSETHREQTTITRSPRRDPPPQLSEKASGPGGGAQRRKRKERRAEFLQREGFAAPPPRPTTATQQKSERPRRGRAAEKRKECQADAPQREGVRSAPSPKGGAKNPGEASARHSSRVLDLDHQVVVDRDLRLVRRAIAVEVVAHVLAALRSR